MEGGKEKHPLLRMKKGSEERVSVQRHKGSVVEISLGTVYQPQEGINLYMWGSPKPSMWLSPKQILEGLHKHSKTF